MTNHTVCHIEFNSTDLQRSQTFYGAVFEWKFRSFGDAMVVFGVGDQHVGGLMKVEEVRSGESPSVWFQVASVDAALEAADAAGGGVRSPKGEVPGVGWSGVFTDPDGNPVGVVEYAQA